MEILFSSAFISFRLFCLGPVTAFLGPRPSPALSCSSTGIDFSRSRQFPKLLMLIVDKPQGTGKNTQKEELKAIKRTAAGTIRVKRAGPGKK